MECELHSEKQTEIKNIPNNPVPINGEFLCHICGLRGMYHYYGRKPPFRKEITFLEDAFIAKDPFAPPAKGLYLFLGSLCAACNQSVCQSQECSMFYTKRFCLPCIQAHYDEFPAEVKKDIIKVQEAKNDQDLHAG